MPLCTAFLPRPSQARSPDPNCNGEVMALYLLLEYTQSAEERGLDADVQVRERPIECVGTSGDGLRHRASQCSCLVPGHLG